MLLPANVAGMSIRNAGEPLTVLVLSLYLFRAVGSSSIPSTSIYVDARVTRVVQHAHSARRSQRLEHCGAAETPRWETKAFLPKHLHRLARRADTQDRLEEGRSFVGSARRGRAPRCQPHRKQSPWAADNDTRRVAPY